MTVEALASFITDEHFLTKSKARQIKHVTSPMENIELHMTELRLKLRLMAMKTFALFGLGHWEEDFVILVVMTLAIVPFILLLILLYIDR